MIWYDVFANWYDLSLERIYRPYRAKSLDALKLEPGMSVLVPACGTGQDLPGLVEAVGPSGRVVGVDYSPGMLARAQRKADRGGWETVSLLERDVRELTDEDLNTAGAASVDRLLFSLALSALPDWEVMFERAYDRLAPGGRFVIFDVHAYKRVPQSWYVEWIAQADLARPLWEPAQRLGQEVNVEKLDGSPHIHGGTPILVSGLKGTA